MIKRIVKLTFQPDNTDIFLAIFDATKANIRQFEGCSHLELWQDSEETHVFFTYSYWNSVDDLEKYRQSDLFQNTWRQVKILFAEKPQAWSVNQIH